LPNFAPTAEQENIIAAALTGENVTVKALAGTGKTSTLALIAEAMLKSSVAYVAYNTDIAEEAKGRFPNNTDARTAHSFAYQAIVKPNNAFGRVKNYPTPSWEAAKVLGIRSTKTYITVDDEGNQTQRTLKTSTLAWIAQNTVAKFCRSADQEIIARHVPQQDGFDKNSHAKLAADILPFAQTYWTLASSMTDKGLIMTHDIYLKLFHLSNPKINASVILFDEAQDANPVIAAIIKLQTHAQVIAVGDENQAIYGFTGAVNALDSFQAKHVLPLTKSFRFGPAIASAANKFLDLLPGTLRVEGYDKVPSEVVGLEAA
jgi:superfamily I DNA/RNA helicase